MSCRHSREHPLSMAHSAVTSADGGRVYVVCGWQGCERRLQLTRAEWAEEEGRRTRLRTAVVRDPALTQEP